MSIILRVRYKSGETDSWHLWDEHARRNIERASQALAAGGFIQVGVRSHEDDEPDEHLYSLVLLRMSEVAMYELENLPNTKAIKAAIDNIDPNDFISGDDD